MIKSEEIIKGLSSRRHVVSLVIRSGAITKAEIEPTKEKKK
ncbi:MAG: hypothetical protein AAB484_03245 [Patescibacteria group bacterium]